MKVLITGATGFIGEKLIHNLVGKNYEVAGLSRGKKENLQLKESGIDHLICDLSDEAESRECCNGADIVIHLAGIAEVSGRGKKSYIKNNVEATGNLVNSAIKHGVRKFIAISSSKVSSNEAGAYAWSKREAEKIIQDASRKSGLIYTIIRCPVVYGKGMQGNIRGWINGMKKKVSPVIPETRSSIPMISVEDLCEAVTACVENHKTNNRIYSVMDNCCYKINDIEKTARRFFGTDRDGVRLPLWCFKMGAKIGDMFSSMNIKFPITSRAYNVIFSSTCEIDKSFNIDTGFEPAHNFLKEIPGIFSDNK